MMTKSPTRKSNLNKPQAFACAVATMLVPTLLTTQPVQASDHADTAQNYNRVGADLTDVFIFPAADPKNVVLVMNTHGLIPAGQSATFDPAVLYQFKIDTTGDSVEDIVIQAKFQGTGRNQRLIITRPAPPTQVGTVNTFNGRAAAQPLRINKNNFVLLPRFGSSRSRFSRPQFMKVFAGVREDPFFFDLERFFQILPDRATPLSGQDVNLPDPNTPKVNGFRPPGEARDFLANMNVLSLVIELPRTTLGNGIIALWETTSLPDGSVFRQQDRLARPAINEVLATVTDGRHDVNNKISPTEDFKELANDIESFLTFPAGRSREIKDVIKSVLVPDVMVADLSQSGPAAYLGVETGGATGGKFGGRKLTDDVVDIDLGAIFGTTVSDLGLAPDDGQAKPQFATDNVGPEAKHFQPFFPYLGSPR